MTREERQSCICTINTLRRLALNIHGVIDVVDNANCDKLIELLNGGTDKTLEQEPMLDKIRAEINRQEKWLLQAGYTAYNVDIAFDTIKAVLAESEVKE